MSFSRGVLLHVYGILKDFGVVHRAPSYQTAVVAERRELVLFNVAVYCLLDAEVLAHL